MKQEIRDQFTRNAILGAQSYPATIFKIADKIDNADVSSIQGKQVIADVYKILNESKTPVLDLKPFISGGEKYEQYDMKLADIINSIKKDIVGNVDLNFLINVCKEEHFKNMMRDGNPSPESTITSIKNEFDKPASQVEKSIKNDIFKSLQSTLLGDIKNAIGYNENEPTKDKKLKLNESLNIFSDENTFVDDFVKYAPVGFIAPVGKENYAFVEKGVYAIKHDGVDSYDIEMIDKSKLNNLPEEIQSLQNAMNITKYDPETCSFTTSKNWDFIINLYPNGDVYVKGIGEKEGKQIDKNDIQNLFIESIKAYNQNPDLCSEYNQSTNEMFIKDADAFNTLAQNSDLIVKFDNLEMVKNLHNNYYAIYSKDYITEMPSKKPKILQWSEDNTSPIFESYLDMLTTIGEKLGCKKLFESIFNLPLKYERDMIVFKKNRLIKLNENQKEINKNLSKITEMKSFTEQHSVAMKKLNESETKLNELLEKNISEMNMLLENKFHYCES